MLIDYPQFAAWGTKHEPIEKVVQLENHPVQQQIFNSWAELYDGIKPTTAQTPVRMLLLMFIRFGCNRKECTKVGGVCVFFSQKQVVNLFVLDGRCHGPLLCKAKCDPREVLVQHIHQCAKMLARGHPGTCSFK